MLLFVSTWCLKFLFLKIDVQALIYVWFDCHSAVGEIMCDREYWFLSLYIYEEIIMLEPLSISSHLWSLWNIHTFHDVLPDSVGLTQAWIINFQAYRFIFWAFISKFILSRLSSSKLQNFWAWSHTVYSI